MEREIVDYKIMTCFSLNDLKSFQRAVLNDISDGWHPLGGVSATISPHGHSYTQTMVKYGGEPS